MKKVISLFVTFVMLLSAIPVFADSDTSLAMEDVLIKVKSKVDIPEEFTEFNPYSYQEGDENHYTFSWSKEEAGAYIDVYCDNEGRISRYNFFDNSLSSKKKLTSLTKDYIIEFADNFVKKSVPEAELYYDEQSWNVSGNTYEVIFKRRVNNHAEVKDNYARVRIAVYDDVAYVVNMVVSYNYDAKFSYKTPAFVNADVISDIYKKQFPLELIYKDAYSKDDENKTVLVYKSKDETFGFVSAVDGSKVEEDDFYDLYFNMSAGGGVTEDAAVANKNMLTDKEIAELSEVANVISKNEADKIIKSLPSVNLDKNMKISSYNIIKRDDEYFVNVYYESDDDKDYKYLSATLNGSTGKVISLSNSSYYDYESVELTDAQKETASKKIEEFVNFVAAEEYVQCKEQDTSVYNNKVSKSYDRYVNGIRYINDGIDITYDVKTGNITSYRLDFDKKKTFEDTSTVISVDEAYNSVIDIAPFKCIWVLSGGEYLPCYTLERSSVDIDAFTGKEYNENTYTEKQDYEYSDIKGHWAEEQITKLAEIQIGFEGTEFNPDAPINQFDLLRLFGAGIRYQSYLTYSEDMLYENFIDEGILTEEEKNPEGQVLREDAFVYMVRIDGLDKVAKLSDIFKVEYADGNLLSDGKIGYPAILTGMGIICGNGGYLKPKTPITRAEAAVMIYNYMINEN